MVLSSVVLYARSVCSLRVGYTTCPVQSMHCLGLSARVGEHVGVGMVDCHVKCSVWVLIAPVFKPPIALLQ